MNVNFQICQAVELHGQVSTIVPSIQPIRRCEGMEYVQSNLAASNTGYNEPSLYSYIYIYSFSFPFDLICLDKRSDITNPCYIESIFVFFSGVFDISRSDCIPERY